MGRLYNVAANRHRRAEAVAGGLRPHPELSVVSLIRDVEADGRTFPAGARGTVVAACADADDYEVEFFKPVHGVVTVGAKDMTD